MTLDGEEKDVDGIKLNANELNDIGASDSMVLTSTGGNGAAWEYVDPSTIEADELADNNGATGQLLISTGGNGSQWGEPYQFEEVVNINSNTTTSGETTLIANTVPSGPNIENLANLDFVSTDVNFYNTTGESEGGAEVRRNDECTKVFIMTFGTVIYEYDIVPYNVSTLSLNSTFDTGSESSDAKSFDFGKNGERLYMIDDPFGSSKTLYEYELTTPYDISTASFTGNTAGLGSPSFIQSVTFKPDGTKMYTVNSGSTQVREWELSTAWDISTLSTTGATLDVSGETARPRGITITDEGSSLIISNNDEGVDSDFGLFAEYTMSTAWDLSTATLNTVQDCPFDSGNGGAAEPYGCVIYPFQNKMLAVGANGQDNIYEYDIEDSSGVEEVILSDSDNNSGKRVTVKDGTGIGADIVVKTGSSLIDGQDYKLIGSDYGAVQFQSDGSNWSIIGDY